MMITILTFLPPAVAAAALIAAAWHDVRSFEVPNRFAAAIAAAFVAASPTGTLSDAAIALALGGGALAAGTALFARGWIGGGDVKLLAAIVLWVPTSLLAGFMMVTSLVGAALALVLMTPARRLFPAPPQALLVTAGSLQALRQPMPFCVAIAAGGIFTLAHRLAA